jgi:3-oxoacyl-[acyl-carrier protein] reductase
MSTAQLHQTTCSFTTEGDCMSDISKSAIVTGASRKIGAAIAERLPRDGIAVAVNFSSNPAPAEALVGKIRQASGRVIAIKADVSDASAVRTI